MGRKERPRLSPRDEEPEVSQGGCVASSSPASGAPASPAQGGDSHPHDTKKGTKHIEAAFVALSYTSFPTPVFVTHHIQCEQSCKQQDTKQCPTVSKGNILEKLFTLKWFKNASQISFLMFYTFEVQVWNSNKMKTWLIFVFEKGKAEICPN